MSAGFNCAPEANTPICGETRRNQNPVGDAELESRHFQGQHLRNPVFSKLTAQGMASMEFKFLVLLSPAASEVGETSRTPSFFMFPVYSAPDPRQYAHAKAHGRWLLCCPLCLTSCDKPRAGRSRGRDAGKKEEVRLQRGLREDLENESLSCKSVSAVEICCFCSCSITWVNHSFSAAACF